MTTLSMFDPTLVKPALVGAFRKLDPRVQFKNPVMFVVFIGSLLTTGLWVQALGGQGEAPAWFIGVTTLWLWFTVLFANFAEALAEGRSGAQAAALRAAKKFVVAKKLREPRHGATVDLLPGTELGRGHVVLVEAGDMIPADGEVIEGAASVNEATITGESAPVIREAGGDFSAVTGGTTVLSDWIVVRITVNPGATFVPFSAQTRMSGVNLEGRQVRKGAADAIRRHVETNSGSFPNEVSQLVDDVSRRGSTPLVVADGVRVLGVIELKDIVKGGIKERFAELRRMGIKAVMITGDNRLTAAAIAAEAGVDDFLAEATPEAKLALIRQYQGEGRLVAMTGDGTNDAPALAQADVAVAMHSGTQAAKEAGNMVDLDSNPTKLLEVVEVGKQLLMTRGALTTFSIANDVAKYFAIIPAMFVVTYPQLNALNVMGLASPASAILSAVIFNALIIVALIPLALKGIKYRPQGAGVVLRRNLAIYGLGGILVPFVGIKIIDLGLAALGLV